MNVMDTTYSHTWGCRAALILAKPQVNHLTYSCLSADSPSAEYPTSVRSCLLGSAFPKGFCNSCMMQPPGKCQKMQTPELLYLQRFLPSPQADSSCSGSFICGACYQNPHQLGPKACKLLTTGTQQFCSSCCYATL